MTTDQPKSPGDLIRQALDNLEACEKDPRYAVAMHAGHGASAPQGDHCIVDLSGAYIAKTMEGDPEKPLSAGDYYHDNRAAYHRIGALECFDVGEVWAGLAAFADIDDKDFDAGKPIEIAETINDHFSRIMGLACELPKPLLDVEVPPYDADNPGGFKIALRDLAERMDSWGLLPGHGPDRNLIVDYAPGAHAAEGVSRLLEGKEAPRRYYLHCETEPPGAGQQAPVIKPRADAARFRTAMDMLAAVRPVLEDIVRNAPNEGELRHAITVDAETRTLNVITTRPCSVASTPKVTAGSWRDDIDFEASDADGEGRTLLVGRTLQSDHPQPDDLPSILYDNKGKRISPVGYKPHPAVGTTHWLNAAASDCAPSAGFVAGSTTEAAARLRAPQGKASIHVRTMIPAERYVCTHVVDCDSGMTLKYGLGRPLMHPKDGYAGQFAHKLLDVPPDANLERSLQAARLAHLTQTRKWNHAAYMTHPVSVARRVRDFTANSDMLSAALLHDVIEDGGENWTAEALQECGINSETIQLVTEMTNVSSVERPDLNRAKRKEMDRERLAEASEECQLIKMADRLDNWRDCAPYDTKFAVQYALESAKLVDSIGGRGDDIELSNAKCELASELVASISCLVRHEKSALAVAVQRARERCGLDDPGAEREADEDGLSM